MRLVPAEYRDARPGWPWFEVSHALGNVAEFAALRGRRHDLPELLEAFGRRRGPVLAPAPPAQGLSSILIPSYNHAAYLGEALESVAQQDWRPLEVVIVDDASQDETRSRLGSLVAKLPNDIDVRVVERRRNHGQSSTINLAVRHARGAVLTVLNSDDYLLHDAVRLARQVMAREGAHLVGAGCILLYGELPDDRVVGVDPASLVLVRVAPGALSELPAFNPTHSGSTFTRAAWDAAGGYRPVHRSRTFHSADRDFQLRVAALLPAVHAPEIGLSFWRQGSSVDAHRFS